MSWEERVARERNELTKGFAIVVVVIVRVVLKWIEILDGVRFCCEVKVGRDTAACNPTSRLNSTKRGIYNE